MNSKTILLFAFLALCASQGLQARHISHHHVEPQLHNNVIEKQQNTLSLDDIIKFFNELVEKVQKIIQEISTQLPEIIKDLEQKISDIINSMQIADTVDKIKEAIQKLVGHSGPEIEKCLEAESDAIDALTKSTQAGIQACVQSAQDQDADLRKEIDVLVQKGSDLITDINNRVQKCVDDNLPDPIAIVQCLEEQIVPLENEISDLEQEVEKLLQVAKDTVDKVTDELQTCLSKVAENSAKQEQAIADDITACASGRQPRNIKNRVNIQDIIKMFEDLIEKIKEIISNAGGSLPEIIKELEEKIKEIIDGLNQSDIVQAIKKAIEMIIGDITEAAKKCIDAESDKINQLAQETQEATQACVTKAQEETAELQKKIETMVQKGEALIEDVKARAQKCVDDHATNPIAMANCLIKQVEPIKQEILELEKEIEETVALAQETANTVGVELNECMEKVSEQTAVKEQEIADDIKKCMLGQPRTFDSRLSLEEIIKVIEEFIQKIQDIVSGAGANLPEIIKQLEEKIKEIIDGLNQSDIVAAIKEAIEKLIGEISEAAKKCIEAESDKINQLAQETQEATMACVQQAEGQTAELQNKVQAVINKGEALIKDVKARAQKCWDDNVPNPIAITNCLTEQVEPIKEEVMELEKEIEDTVRLARETANKISIELSQCMEKVSEETAVKEQAIAEDIKKCMLGQNFKNVDSRLSLDEILKIIEDFIQKIKDIIGNAGSSLPEIIKQLEEKIKEIIDGLNQSDIVEAIKQAIEKLIGEISEAAKKCIEAESDKINQLAQETQEASMACVQKAEEQTAELQNKIQDILNKGEALIENIKARAQKCWDDNVPNPIAIASCLTEQVDPIKEEIMQLEKEVEDALALAQDVSNQVGVQLTECLDKVAEETAVKEEAIAEDIKKCMLGQN